MAQDKKKQDQQASEDSVVKEDSPVTTDTKQEHSLTPEERALSARIASDDSSWQTISEEDLGDFSLREDAYKLPSEAAEKLRQKKFAFRWIAKTPERLDEIRSLDPPARWGVCNATNTPFLAKYVDPAHGGIQKLDQILVFKPYWMWEMHQKAKLAEGNAKIDSGDISKRDGQQEDWGEWKAGPEQRITGKDEVMADYAQVDEAVNE